MFYLSTEEVKAKFDWRRTRSRLYSITINRNLFHTSCDSLTKKKTDTNLTTKDRELFFILKLQKKEVGKVLFESDKRNIFL